MYRRFILILAASIALFGCEKDSNEEENDDQLIPVQQQWGFALNYTASWCGPCGSWGAPLIHDFADAGNVVAITAHAANDPMHNSQLYDAFASDRPVGGGIPSFYIGDVKSTSMSDLENLLEQSAKAGIAMKHSMNGSTMTIDTRTQFFSTQAGIFNLVVLILESGIDGSETAGDYAQNGTETPDSYVHDFVLRASSSEDNVYGEEIATDPSNGDIIDKQFVVDINPDWTNDVYPVVILWKKNSLGEPVFEFINAAK